MVTYGNVCVVMNPETKKNLQRLAIAEHTTLSDIINLASERYINEYLRQKQEQMQQQEGTEK